MTNRILASIMLAAALAVPSRLPAQGPDGLDFSSAIPIVFGQVTQDIGDSRLKPRQIYKINLARGQKFNASISTVDGAQVKFDLYLVAPSVKSLASWGNADTSASDADYSNNARTSRSITYQVPVAGAYYVAVFFNSTGINYKLQAIAEGTPVAVPNPTSAGCLTGRVDYLTYSLQLIAVGLADEVSIGSQRACPSCTVKAPLYPEIVNRLELALRSKTNVEACYDSTGSIFQIKLVTP